jgi:hypothetical protein
MTISQQNLNSQLQVLLDFDKLLTVDVRFYMNFEQFKSASVPRDLSHKIEDFIEEHYDVFNGMKPIKPIDSQGFDSLVSEIRQYFDSKLKAGELAQLSPDSSVDLQGAAIDSVQVTEQFTAKGFIQTSIDFISDFFQASVFDGSFKKPKSKKSPISAPSSVPIQLTLFELLQPHAIEQFNKMQALLQAYLKDVAELKNPQSRLFKMLGSKAQKRLAELENKLGILRRDLAFHFFCWELPLRLWVVN